MSSVYPAVLFVHSVLRWAVLGACVAAVAWATYRWMLGAAFEQVDQRVARALVALVDLQLLLGLLLYGVLSPISNAAFHDVRAAMGNTELRRFLVEHPFAMLCGVVAIHWGFARAKRLGDDARRHRALAFGAAAGLLLFLVGLPWQRPFFRGLP